MSHDDRVDPETLFDQHFDRVYGYVAYRLAPDLDAAADVTQEVFLAALDPRQALRGESSIATWLRGIARRKVADHYRRNAARARTADNYRAALASADNGTETQRIEQALIVGRIMSKLPDHHAELLELKYLDGLSVRDIARQRGTTEKSVESALTRARDAFRKLHEEFTAHQESQP